MATAFYPDSGCCLDPISVHDARPLGRERRPMMAAVRHG